MRFMAFRQRGWFRRGWWGLLVALMLAVSPWTGATLLGQTLVTAIPLPGSSAGVAVNPTTNRVYAAFGIHLPDDRKRAAAPQNLPLNRAGMDVIRRTDICDELAAITSPTLVCVGELDPVTPVGASEEIVRALPDGIGRLEVVPGAGHFTWLDPPDAYWSILGTFIRQVIS